MPTIEGYITTDDGVRLFYLQTGSGAPVLLPNGLHLCDDFERLAEGRTPIYYDVRNRGRSDTVTDSSKLARGILQDVEDLDAVRRHFGIGRIDAVAHSYTGVILAEYAKQHPDRVNRLLMIGPMQPDAAAQYPADLTGEDGTVAEVFSRLAALQKEMAASGQPQDPVKACEEFWSVLRRIYVFHAADAEKIHWGRCELPNERNMMKYWNDYLFPSIQSLRFAAADLGEVQTPVLIVHGRRDRSSPYGGGREWAVLFPNARLVTVENAAHAPWIEAPEMVFGAIAAFLDGRWPDGSEKVEAQA